jgi:hypothetical protein
VIVVWERQTPGPRYDFYALRLTSTGAVASGWPAAGEGVVTGSEDFFFWQIQPDSAGGCFVPFYVIPGQGGPGDADARLQHVLSDGTLPPGFGPEGIAVSATPNSEEEISTVADGHGGLFYVWTDFTNLVIYAKHLQFDGTLVTGWPGGGLRLTPLDSYAVAPVAAIDTLGGCFVGRDEEPIAGGIVGSFVTHLSASGDSVPGWPLRGVLMGTRTTDGGIKIASDGSGGLYAAWTDSRNAPANDPGNNYYSDIYAQHLLADGSRAPGWPVNGLPVCTAPYEQIIGGSQTGDCAMSDGQGGVIFVWLDRRDEGPPDYFSQVIYAMRLKPDGTPWPGWNTNGNPVAVRPDYPAASGFAPDGHGGIYVTYDTSYQSYLQHLMGDGTVDPTYGPNGNCVVPGTNYPEFEQQESSIASDGGEGVYVAWRNYASAQWTIGRTTLVRTW